MSTEPRIAVTLSSASTVADAVRYGGYLYTSGISALDDKGALVAPGDLRAQADHIYARLTEVLKSANVSWSQVVKINTYVAPEVRSAAERRILADAHKAHVAPGRCAALAAPLPQPHEGSLLQVELIARPGATLEPIAAAEVPVASDW